MGAKGKEPEEGRELGAERRLGLGITIMIKRMGGGAAGCPRSADFNQEKAPEGWRSPRRWRAVRKRLIVAKLLECGSPLPL